MFRACKLGDINTLRTLIETKQVDVDFRDKFDSTPLYYACLCGHIDLVRFLLEYGAKCDIKTFDGERCIYAALTDDIRGLLLKEYKVINKKILRRDDYDEFLRNLFEQGQYYDVLFNINQIESIKAHSFILKARCEYFAQTLDDISFSYHLPFTINIINEITPKAFKIFLYYIYTGILEFPLKLNEEILTVFKFVDLNDICEQIQYQITNLKQSKCKNKNVTIFIKNSIEKDFRKLFITTLPDKIRSNYETINIDVKCWQRLSDIIFQVEKEEFYCHKLFFTGRSEYFMARIKDHFSESIPIYANIPVLKINERIDLFTLLACFLYSNSAEMTLDQAWELLIISDVYLFNSLKRYCANIIGNNISNFNPVDIIQVSRILNLPKLEAIATQYIAKNLKQYLNQDDFKNLVLSDAQSVRQRQETDSIDIIDDIRYYLFISPKKEDQHNLRQIDLLLESLGLDA